MLNAIGVASNAAVNGAQPLYVADVTPDRENRQFYQQISDLPRTGASAETRLVDVEASTEFALSVLSHPERKDRLERTIQQYVLALRYWTPDTKALALTHVFMAAEALVPLAKGVLGKTSEELAELGRVQVNLNQPMRRSRDVESAADGYARRTVVFHEDRQVHSKTRKMSDGFEHGFGDFADLIKTAHEVGESAMSHVRRAIIELSPLRTDLKGRLLAERFSVPIGIHSHAIALGTMRNKPSSDRDYRPPLDMLALKAENISYDQESGSYRFEINVNFQSDRTDLSDLRFSARP